ncbi:MAG: peptide chain release factor 1 [Erysipelothrix sp.]|nr:peptide chain release factor 1 [Erysipelothrix sp.]
MEAILKRLESAEVRYEELNELLMLPETLADNRVLAKLAKEQASIMPLHDGSIKLKGLNQEISDTEELIELDDAEMVELAKMELEQLLSDRQDLLDHLEIMLIPKDPHDSSNAIVEIRGAAGGDEGNIFAGDLFRMYTKYAEASGRKLEILGSSPADMGGYSDISFMIKGDDAYRHLKFESGAHRVQRVPKTETQGRVHTSTATVLVLPEVEESEFEIDENDLEISTHRATGAGGQHVNTTDSAVRIIHKPTNIQVNVQDGRSQHENKALAMKLIRTRVADEIQRIEDEKTGDIRKSKIGTGDRSEKIRTYNYPQNRVTDHRIGLTINQLDRIVEGKMDQIVEELLAFEQREKLAGNVK